MRLTPRCIDIFKLLLGAGWLTTDYVGLPAETAEAHRDGYFRTGDLGSLDREGYLTLRGRAKDMVNSAGVKVFPAEVVGPAFFKAVRGPLPQVRIMPTGGVDLTTAANFLKAGACCLGIGSQLVEPAAVAGRNFDRLRDLARQYVTIVRQARPDHNKPCRT